MDSPRGHTAGRPTHPASYPHSGIPFPKRFPTLTAAELTSNRESFGCGDSGAEELHSVADALRILFGVPCPGEYSPDRADADTWENYLAHKTGGTHGDQRRPIDDLKDSIIESIALDAETVRTLGRSIDARLAALEALEAMLKEAEDVHHE